MTDPTKQGATIWRTVLIRLLELAILGGLSAGAIETSLRPALAFIAGAGGGMYASRLFRLIRNNTALRAWVEANYVKGRFGPGLVNILAGMVGWAFFSPATAAAIVAVLGLILSGLAAGVLAYFANGSVSDAWAAFLAFLASQALYFLNHPHPEPSTAPISAPAAVGAEHDVETAA